MNTLKFVLACLAMTFCAAPVVAAGQEHTHDHDGHKHHEKHEHGDHDKHGHDHAEGHLHGPEVQVGVNAQKLIGTAASQLKQNKIAAEAFESYLALKPNASDKVQTIYQLGTAYMSLGDNSKACSYFKEIAQDEKFGEAARYQITQLKCN